MHDLRLTRRARDDIAGLNQALRKAVLETLDGIALEPEVAGKPLVGRLAGIWSSRVGNYRVLYTVEDHVVMVRSVRHRGVVYRARRRARKR